MTVKLCKTNGFTLIEMSIVISIIGILLATVVSGANMLKTSRLNGVITELQGYKSAMLNFKEKYKALPGDLANAEDFWGTYNSSSNVNGVDNGDGDGRYNNITERYQTWSHLSKAGFISGDYVSDGTTESDQEIGVNNPGSKTIDNALFIPVSNTIYDDDITVLQFKGIVEGANNWEGVITAENAYYIDKKMDDGESGLSSSSTGIVLTLRSDSMMSDDTKCVDDFYTSNSSNYILTDDEENCRIAFDILN